MRGEVKASKRLVLAITAFLLSFLAFAIDWTVPAALRYGWRQAEATLEMMMLYFIIAMAGWLLALPFVVLLKSTYGYRKWLILAIGSCLGPAIIGGWALVAGHGYFSWGQDGLGIVLSLVIGVPTTIFYILLL